MLVITLVYSSVCFLNRSFFRSLLLLMLFLRGFVIVVVVVIFRHPYLRFWVFALAFASGSS